MASEIRVHVLIHRGAVHRKMNCFFFGFKAAQFHQGMSVTFFVLTKSIYYMYKLNWSFLQWFSIRDIHLSATRVVMVLELVSNLRLTIWQFTMACNLIKKETLAQMFFYEFLQNFQERLFLSGVCIVKFNPYFIHILCVGNTLMNVLRIKIYSTCLWPSLIN